MYNFYTQSKNKGSITETMKLFGTYPALIGVVNRVLSKRTEEQIKGSIKRMKDSLNNGFHIADVIIDTRQTTENKIFRFIAGDVVEVLKANKPATIDAPSTTTESEQSVTQPERLPATRDKMLTKIFEVFNASTENLEMFKANLMPKLSFDKTKAEDGLNKLHKALKHFADKNQDKKLSEEQMEMLKKNSAFLDWVCSILPETLQKLFGVEDRVNRYVVDHTVKSIGFFAPWI
jgi:hypothetical protein